MKFIDIGLDYFEDKGNMEVFVKTLNEDGTIVNRKLSDLIAGVSETDAAQAQALKDIGAKRLK